VNEPISVEARFRLDGTIQPLAFLWQEKRYPVAALGRQWEQDQEKHFLVMTPNNKVYEISYSPGEGAWRLRRRPEDFGGARQSV
jgi:hypothetical protein